jgi:hypothetical protein
VTVILLLTSRYPFVIIRPEVREQQSVRKRAGPAQLSRPLFYCLCHSLRPVFSTRVRLIAPHRELCSHSHQEFSDGSYQRYC